MNQASLSPHAPTRGAHLLADLGGTHARLSWLSSDGQTEWQRTLPAADYASPDDAIRHFLELATRDGNRDPAEPPASVNLAVASADRGPLVQFTNAPWSLDLSRLGHLLGPAPVRLMNDFEALAWSLPLLQESDLMHVGGPAIGLSGQEAVKAVMGPGTGLGLAACIRAASGWQAVATEGGHATLAAHDPLERAVLDVLAHDWPHVSAERLLSGSGLPLLHHAISQAKGQAARAPTTAVQLIDQALRHQDPAATETLTAFCDWLGSCAGSAALTLGARGGLMLGGGILPRIPALLLASNFRARFEAKGRFRSYLQQVATPLITHPNPALLGLKHRLMLDGLI